jgi:hypothetical protein
LRSEDLKKMGFTDDDFAKIYETINEMGMA